MFSRRTVVAKADQCASPPVNLHQSSSMLWRIYIGRGRIESSRPITPLMMPASDAGTEGSLLGA